MPALAPEEQPTDAASVAAYQEDGAGNFNLPEELQRALRSLLIKFEDQNRDARREEVKRIERQRGYFRGNQNTFFDERTRRWAQITTAGLVAAGTSSEAAPVVNFDYVENIYRAHSLISMGVLGQNPPHCRFVPQDFSAPEDLATAKAAKTAAELISDNNNLDERQSEAIWYFDHDGLAATYTYFDVSGERYGYKTRQPTRNEPMPTPGSVSCPGCGWSEEIAMPPEGITPEIPATCPSCLAPIAPESVVQPEMMDNIVPDGPELTIEQGQEQILFLGGLEFVRPYYPKDLASCPWVMWEGEFHRAWLKSFYPHVAPKIGRDGSGESSEGDEVEARMARLALAQTSYGRETGDSSNALVTFRRMWMRPWAFYELEDEAQAKKLTELFPKGVYCAFAGSIYCEAKPEKIEKRWAMRHAMPGDGMIRDGILTDLVDEQRKLNTQENLAMEMFERGLGSRFMGEAVDYDAYMEAGSGVNEHQIKMPPGSKASDFIYDSPDRRPSPEMIAASDSLRGERTQFLVGHPPSIFGGDTGTNDTASGISIMKDSATGRQSLYKKALNGLYADTMKIAIECMRENRTEDAMMAIQGKGSEMDSQLVKLDELRGNIFARTDASESFPFTIEQQRAVILEMIGSPNPAIQAAVNTPDNFDLLKNALGIKDLKLPGEDARRKQYDEIEMMKQGVLVKPDALMDQHDVEMAALTEWFSSKDGQTADEMTKELVRQHLQAHLEARAMQAALIQAASDKYIPPQPQPGTTPEGETSGADAPPVQ